MNNLNNIVEFAKNLSLTAEDKALRDTGLNDTNGNYTETAIRIAADLEAKSLGFKDMSDMEAKYGFDAPSKYGVLEVNTLITKYKTDLIDIANKMIAEKSKK